MRASVIIISIFTYLILFTTNISLAGTIIQECNIGKSISDGVTDRILRVSLDAPDEATPGTDARYWIQIELLDDGDGQDWNDKVLLINYMVNEVKVK